MSACTSERHATLTRTADTGIFNPCTPLRNDAEPSDLRTRWAANGQPEPAEPADSADEQRFAVARSPGSNGPGPSKAVPREQGPVTASEARLAGAQRGAAALALDWDVLEGQAAALADGDDGDGRGNS